MCKRYTLGNLKSVNFIILLSIKNVQIIRCTRWFSLHSTRKKSRNGSCLMAYMQTFVNIVSIQKYTFQVIILWVRYEVQHPELSINIYGPCTINIHQHTFYLSTCKFGKYKN